MQVCPNGAKVRLNMGITERRYQNWDAALGHYLRAKELAGRGFCEPDYWIGVTRINRGVDIDIGVEVRPCCCTILGIHSGGDPHRTAECRTHAGIMMYRHSSWLWEHL